MSALIHNCTGAILAGGENTRMPLLKSFIEVGGEKIIERNIGITRQLFKEYFIVTNQPEYYAALGVPLLGDVYDVRGPITGIFTVLLNASNSWVFISACDMPFLNTDLMVYMATKRAGNDAVVPVLDGGPEPLFAFYSRRLVVRMEKALLSGRKSLRDFLRNKRVEYIPIEEIREIDARMTSFVNLNSPEDIERHLQKNDITGFKRSLKGR